MLDFDATATVANVNEDVDVEAQQIKLDFDATNAPFSNIAALGEAAAAEANSQKQHEHKEIFFCASRPLWLFFFLF